MSMITSTKKNHIGLVGFEPTASWSRTRRSTKLSHSPKWNLTLGYAADALFISRILVSMARRSSPVVFDNRRFAG